MAEALGTITAEDLMKNLAAQGGAGKSEPTAPEERPSAPSPGSITADDLTKNLEAKRSPAAPAPDTTDYGKLGWDEVSGRMLAAAPGSFVKTIGQVGNAIMHPVETGSALLDLGKGALSAGAGYFMKQDPAQKAKDEASFNALREEYGQRYGDLFSGAAGLKKTLATDPFAVGMDVASFAPVAGLAGRAAGLTKAGALAETAMSALDPTQIALKTAEKLTDFGGGLTKGVLGGTSGTTKSALDMIENTARRGDAGANAAFLKGAWGDESLNTALPQMLEDSVNEWGKSIQDDFGRRKASLNTQQLDPRGIELSINKAANELQAYRKPSGEWVSDDFPREAEILNEMERRLYNRRDMSAAGLHNMKVGFSDLMDGLMHSRVKGAIGKVPEAVRKTIADAEPEYAKMMDMWQQFRKEAKDLASEFGASRHISTAAKIAKLVRSIQKNKNQHLFDLLRNTPSGKYLPEIIAGATVREVLPDWANKIQNLALTGIAGTTLGLGAPHAVLALAGMSPKVAGHLAWGYGGARRLGDIAGSALTPPVTNVLSQIGSEENPLIKTTPTPVQGSMFAGGRIARQSGGRVGNPGSAADKLIAAAEKAKNRHSDDTSPLLDVPDEAITKALAIANEKI